MPRLLRLAIVVLLLAAGGYLFYASTHTAQFHVKVCVTYRGETACSEAAGKTREEAQKAGHDTACGIIASGVTDTVACQRTEASSIQWLP